MVIYEGDSFWCKKLQQYLNEKLELVIEKFPKILEHIGESKIYILDEYPFAGRKPLGYYNTQLKTINVLGSECDHELYALHTLFHEIGHCVIDKRKGISRDYNSVNQNPSYFREEIRAESYALQIFSKYLDFKEIRDYLFRSIKYLYKGLKDSIRKERNRVPSYSYYGYSWTASSATGYSYVKIGGSSNSSTWNGSFSWCNTSVKVDPTYSINVSFAC
jgi:hypothetical protein